MWAVGFIQLEALSRAMGKSQRFLPLLFCFCFIDTLRGMDCYLDKATLYVRVSRNCTSYLMIQESAMYRICWNDAIDGSFEEIH